MMIPFGEASVDASKVVHVGSYENVCICQYATDAGFGVLVATFDTHRAAEEYVRTFEGEVNAARAGS